MKVAGDWVDHPGTQALCRVLEDAGHRALFVGGCVRNALMGVPVSDIDIATDALPTIVSELAESAGFRVIPTGIDHGTVTVIANGVAHEVTTFRRDEETDGRHAVVAFSARVEEDAARRDFTMNALYADRAGAVIDPLGGLPDLMARRVRFVGNADARIIEDFLRILRFFRFHAHYGDPDSGVDVEGLAACAAYSTEIETLSRERIGAEMRKLLAAPDPAPAVAAMAAAGVLAVVLPGAEARALAPLVYLESGRSPGWLRRLAVLGGQDVGNRLRLSRREAADLGRIRAEIGGVLGPAALGFVLGDALGADAVLARAAMLEQALPEDWEKDIARGAAAQFPLRAADFIDRVQGPALGAALAAAQKRWLASDLMLTRAELLG
ncbi:MAG: CCA tRNA nucleotidyltransferase [Pseudotabrizicola sp.]|uniref:CCA tRNA nucleotidyltransferase n=1 Tax=Pseudotabrizicola sp. TaxID=2939647 RepID=UPI002731D5F0|nr:CCA tRNA nucleotidyltransferase [Pseudotabrizicola sp.]MDP2083365.1 CCA tRNA nucleotidyltransferase [Pseudotabrizicola sp.]MDZ7574903.1 CCA tRNA nucleotidyltransferase [Pseudotabrizicola sp.]